ncbi:MAG: hypothetical protein PUG76_00070 [Prevotellaceae bacterium]|nr:hypothetical protein [Prevotellaceae bacterium]
MKPKAVIHSEYLEQFNITNTLDAIFLCLLRYNVQQVIKRPIAMSRSQKIKLALVAVVIIIAIVYIIVDPEGLETIVSCAVFGFMLLVGWANSSSPADTSRETIDWEMEQERRKEEEESEEAIRQRHHDDDQ